MSLGEDENRDGIRRARRESRKVDCIQAPVLLATSAFAGRRATPPPGGPCFRADLKGADGGNRVVGPSTLSFGLTCRILQALPKCPVRG